MNQLQDKFEKALDDSRDIFLAHMEEKYGVTFLPISYTSSGSVVNEEFRCYAEGTDRERDYVSVFRKVEDGKEVFHDDYFGIIIREEYQNRIQKISDNEIGSAKAYVNRYSVSFFEDSLTSEYTIDDAIAMGVDISASKYIYFEVQDLSEEEFQAACDQIADELTESKLPGFVIFVGLAAGELANINEDNYIDYIPSMINPDGQICLMLADRYISIQ